MRPSSEILLKIGQKVFVIRARFGIAVAALQVGEFDGRVACAHQIDAHEFAGGGQVARVFLDRAEQIAGGGLKPFDTAHKAAILGLLDRAGHGAEVFLCLVHSAGHAILLKAVDAFSAFVFQRVQTEGEAMQDCAQNRKDHGVQKAVARKTFPHSGEYDSAGRRNGVDLKPGLMNFMEGHGLVLGPVVCKAVESDVHKLAKYDVVVSLQGPIDGYLSAQPFRTVFLDWDVGAPPEGTGDAEIDERYTEMYREITVRVRDLMETLRGEGAD